MNRVLISIVLCLGVTTLFFGCVHRVKTLDKSTAGIFLEPEERYILPEGVELRKVYDKGVELVKRSEGLETRLYNDAAGYCTIGYGHLIKKARCDGSEPKAFRKGLSEAAATDLLREDLVVAELAVMRAVTADISDGQFAALVDFTFNVGSGNLRKSTLLKRVNAVNLDDVPNQFRRWVKAGGQVLKGLQVRRENEIDLYFDGLPIPRAVPSADEDLEAIDVMVGEAP